VVFLDRREAAPPSGEAAPPSEETAAEEVDIGELEPEDIPF